MTNKYILTEADKLEIAKQAELRNILFKKLEILTPEYDKETIGTISHDLSDIWSISRNCINQIEAMRNAEIDDRATIVSCLEEIFHGETSFHLPGHLESMAETLPAYIEALDVSNVTESTKEQKK